MEAERTPLPERLARLCGIPAPALQEELERSAGACDATVAELLREAVVIAERSVNQAAPGSPIAALRVVAESVAAGAAGAVRGARMRQRALAARTLTRLKQLGLYRDPYDSQPVWPHAGMLILNPFLGCSYGCVYCFRAPEQVAPGTDWFLKGTPVRVMEDEEIVEQLLAHHLFVANVTALGLHSATTDPFLPQVRESTFRLLALLAARGLANDVMIITKYYLTREDVERLDACAGLRILLLLTFNGSRSDVEPMGAGDAFRKKRWETLGHLERHARHLLWGHYYRPLVAGWNDRDEQIAESLRFGDATGVSVLGGLKYIDGLDAYLDARGVPRPARTSASGGKELSEALLARVFAMHARLGLTSVLVGDQSCGLTVLQSRRALTPNVEALRMYDAAEPARAPRCMGRCSREQLHACAHPPPPSEAAVGAALSALGLDDVAFRVAPDGLYLQTEDETLPPSVRDALIARLRYAVFAAPGPTQGAR